MLQVGFVRDKGKYGVETLQEKMFVSYHSYMN